VNVSSIAGSDIATISIVIHVEWSILYIKLHVLVSAVVLAVNLFVARFILQV